jgi:hypothetical protein
MRAIFILCILAREWLSNGSLDDIHFGVAETSPPTPLFKLSFWKKVLHYFF